MNTKLIMLMESLRAFVKREDGASAIEYALIAGLLAMAIIGGAQFLGGSIDQLFMDIAEALGFIEVDTPVGG